MPELPRNMKNPWTPPPHILVFAQTFGVWKDDYLSVVLVYDKSRETFVTWLLNHDTIDVGRSGGVYIGVKSVLNVTDAVREHLAAGREKEARMARASVAMSEAWKSFEQRSRELLGFSKGHFGAYGCVVGLLEQEFEKK